MGARITNVSLTGNVNIRGYRGVGGIVGNGFPVMTDCSVEAEGTIYATYWGVGGILGFASDKGAKVYNATVKGVGNGLTISSYLGGVGGVTGTPHCAATTGATVSNVTISSSNNYYMAYVDAGGAVSGTVVVEDVVVKVNGEAIIGNDAVAAIGGVGYFSLQSAIDAVQNSETITLLRDVKVEEAQATNNNAVYYVGDKSFVLDLNGKTITGNTSNVVLRFQKANGIENTITIKNGKIVSKENSFIILSRETLYFDFNLIPPKNGYNYTR
jgi:hypothetical protein